MPTIAEVRAKYPQYQDMSDADLAGALHRKFYSDMPIEDFNSKIGLSSSGPAETRTTEKTDRLPMSTTGVLKDLGRSALSGVRQGVESLAGAVGSANEATGSAVEWVANSLGASPQTANAFGSVARRMSPMGFALTTDEIQGATNGLVGKPYEPQTVGGEYARTIGEFAPNSLLGPGGLARKTAMTVIPAVASETAGQMAEGTSLESAARIAGGLLGGAAAAGRSPSAVRMAAADAPTAEALKAQTDKLYGVMREAGIKYDADAYASTVQTMADDLLKQGLRPSVAKDAFALVDDLAKGIGHSPDFDDVNGLVVMIGQKARDAVKQGDNTSAKAFNVVRDHLMRFEEGATLSSRVPIPADELNRVRLAARDTAKRNIKSRVLDEILLDAETYQGGFESGVRNQIGNLMRSKRGKQLFKGEERAALLEVANGRKALRTLSRFGLDMRSWAGNASLMPTLGAGAASYAIEPLAGGALLAAGTVAKELSPRLTTRAFQNASAAVRSGRLQDPTVMNEVKAERLRATVRRLLAADASVSSSQ